MDISDELVDDSLRFDKVILTTGGQSQYQKHILYEGQLNAEGQMHGFGRMLKYEFFGMSASFLKVYDGKFQDGKMHGKIRMHSFDVSHFFWSKKAK